MMRDLWQTLDARERAWALAALLASLAVRLGFFDFVSGDMRGDMIPWAEIIEREGGFKALGRDFSNYPPLYLYLLWVASWLPWPKLYAIKTVYLVFDYVAAFYVADIVRQRFGPSRRTAVALVVVLFLPTVLLNSSLWGQCDAMYASGLMAAVAYLLRRDHGKAMVAFGLAFALKPQAVFLAPLLIALVWQGRFTPLLLYVVPAVYLLLAVPAWIAGRPLLDLLFLYANQRILPFPALTLGATNLYQWLPDDRFDLLFVPGLVLAAAAALGLVLVLCRRYPSGMTDEGLVRGALVSLVLMPFVLPAMHERYFFAADLLAVAYAFWFARGWVVAALIQVASLFTYLPYLFDLEPIPRPILAVAMAAALTMGARALWEPKPNLEAS